MSTDDFLLDQVERSQRSRTQQRRDGRSQRRHVLLLLTFLSLVGLGVAAPGLISHSSIGRNLVARAIESYGLTADVDSMRIGWLTPLRVSGLNVTGRAGSSATIEQLDADLTAADLLVGATSELGQVTVRGIDVACVMRDGECSLEQDLALLLEPSAGPTTTAAVKLQDVTVSVSDDADQRVWKVTQSSAEFDVTLERLQGAFAGVLTEPGGSGGSIQGSIELLQHTDDRAQPAPWRVELSSESLPLSVVSLVQRRFPESAASIPARIQGDATGSLVIVGAGDGAVEASVRQLNVRNFTAVEAGSRVWSNRLATLDGDLILVGDRVIGQQLKATADFASATIDGAFSRSFSLIGVNDNPLRWLEAIDGRAVVEADLAAMDQSLPGMLPLRDEAELISGKVVARVDSTINGSLRRSNLAIRSQAIRARSGGHAVVIDPIEFEATVSSNGGPLKADRFQWSSAFGTAVGYGDLRSGNADVEVDFGRLTSMLRPIVKVSESSLAGRVRGKIRWDAADNDTWRLAGDGDATNLVIGMPNGQTLRRASLQGKVEAVGRWGGDALAELTRADLSLASGGLDLRAELVQAIGQPTATKPLPIRILGTGRVDTLLETFGPWLPAQLHDGAGSFRANARAEVSTQSARLTAASIELADPRIAYNDRYFAQPNVKVHFDGDCTWPSRDLLARSLTIAGDAFSIAAQGSATALGDPAAERIDMEIRWRAKLDRIQGSVRRSIATRTDVPVRPVSFRDQPRERLDVGPDQWLITGDCEGAIDVTTRNGVLNVDTHATGSELVVRQPQSVISTLQAVGPLLQPAHGADRYSGQVVWEEPSVKLDGWIRYDRTTGRVTADELQVAGNWFATTLGGTVLWDQGSGDIRLQGPARLKMDAVAQRLSRLLGVTVYADGIHETPLDIRAYQHPDGTVGIDVAAKVGWERSQIGGIVMGPTEVPVRLTETTVNVGRATIPLAGGSLNVAGQVHYRPGPLWMRVEPGSSARSLRLTPEITESWLKYVAPLAANAARIEGTIGIELDEALVVVDQPEQSRVIGRLNINGVEMTSGPLANQIYNGISQLKLLARSVASDPVGGAGNHTLITMPAQTVDFAVDRGWVQHNRMFFQVDRAEVITSGRVALDGQLSLFAQVPLDERWLGSDLKGLAGQPVTLPIDGTLARPSLDSSGVRQVVAELGSRAVQETAENYLEKELRKGLDKLLGR